MHYRAPTLLCALAAATATIAATAPSRIAPQVLAVQDCRAQTDGAARLACYDKAVDALSAATASQEVVVVDRTEVRRARKGLFGFTLPRIGLLAGRAGNAEDEADAKQLDAVVTSVRQLPYGKWRFTVEGAGTWETTETSMNFDDPKVGARVLLEKGSLGGYYAKVGKGRRVQAKRIG